MRSIGVREFREQATRVLREVRNKRNVVEVTYRGRPVARLVPVGNDRRSPKRAAAVWADLDRLAVEIGKRWSGRQSARRALRNARRAL